MADRKDYMIESDRGKDFITKCAHCNGHGSSRQSCCQKRADLAGSGCLAPCCVCGGAGKVRV